MVASCSQTPLLETLSKCGAIEQKCERVGMGPQPSMLPPLQRCFCFFEERKIIYWQSGGMGMAKIFRGKRWQNDSGGWAASPSPLSILNTFSTQDWSCLHNYSHKSAKTLVRKYLSYHTCSCSVDIRKFIRLPQILPSWLRPHTSSHHYSTQLLANTISLHFSFLQVKISAHWIKSPLTEI